MLSNVRIVRIFSVGNKPVSLKFDIKLRDSGPIWWNLSNTVHHLKELESMCVNMLHIGCVFVFVIPIHLYSFHCGKDERRGKSVHVLLVIIKGIQLYKGQMHQRLEFMLES